MTRSASSGGTLENKCGRAKTCRTSRPRSGPIIVELQPALFCEISPELASERDIAHGAWVTIATARGVIEARAMVTSRIPPLRANGRVYHQVGLPYHWGPRGVSRGDVVNDLLAISEEPNVRIMESKALVCDVRRGRRPRNGS
jgi:formate dehydrogenase major subunit